MDTHFNINRFFLVLKRDLLENGKTALFGMLSILGTFSIIVVLISLNSYDKGVSDYNATFYLIELFIIGIFFSGMAFKDLRNKERSMFYLTLPASTLEKFLSMLLLTTIGFLVSYTILFGIFNLINIAIISALPNALNLDLFNPFIVPEVWESIAVFIPLQAFFLAGSAHFKKTPVLYTSLSLFVLLLIFAFFGFLFIKYLLDGFTENTGINIADDSIHLNLQGEFTNIKLTSLLVFNFFSKYLLAPILWTITWFKLKEKEV